MEKKQFSDVGDYIANFPYEVRERLNQIRQIILTTAPEAEESISYAMPAYKYRGRPLVYFAGFSQHIGLYALPSGHEAFKEALSGYKTGKGSVQFPHNKPLPLDLIAEIVQFRVKENNARQKKNSSAQSSN